MFFWNARALEQYNAKTSLYIPAIFIYSLRTNQAIFLLMLFNFFCSNHIYYVNVEIITTTLPGLHEKYFERILRKNCFQNIFEVVTLKKTIFCGDVVNCCYSKSSCNKLCQLFLLNSLPFRLQLQMTSKVLQFDETFTIKTA